jgi:hypothetical protein
LAAETLESWQFPHIKSTLQYMKIETLCYFEKFGSNYLVTVLYVSRETNNKASSQKIKSPNSQILYLLLGFGEDVSGQ